MPPPKPADVAAKERNEYIPTFISKKPFYIDDSLSADTSASQSAADYLDHQRLQTTAQESSKWYDRGRRLGPAATKFRKGACENCGSMTHKTKECLSRPRKQGARWTGRDIQADELVQDVQLGWDAKRDRWNGYDASEYKNVLDEYAQMDELRKLSKLSGEGAQKKLELGQEDEDDADADATEEAKYAEESEMGRQQAKATRQLRIREDTAKYLLNLDLESAKYDPKTRSMVDSGATADQAAALVAEDNFMRASGDAAEFERAQKYAWETQERGDKNKQHIQANPTSGEYFRNKEKEETDAKKEAHRKMLLEKYGGEQHMKPSPLAQTAITESERYVEYDEQGLIKGAPKVSIKSQYPEDVLINNHTAVWGSWWRDFKWGYACCHSVVKNSYCTGEEGKQAFEAAEDMRTGGALEAPTHPEAASVEEAKTPIDPTAGDNSKRDGTDATWKTEENAKKRSLYEMKGGISEEELEAYRKKRTVANDPMAAFLGKDELVH